MRWVTLLMLATLACDDAGRRTYAYNAQTPRGVLVYVPSWIDATLRAEALGEIDAAGVPLDWSVIVRVPIFEAVESPTGIARGLTRYYWKVIEVGWRVHPYEDRPLMPALTHEMGHVTGGPDAGH